ncbi:hypothetical protein Tco_0185225 [Tanacetum coccineum]|uniref:Uncharacterized protein n=1 Tax=Tanacetum coccineum TaxID=301880 RepID=A0ABQ4Y827_9ASTR
MKDGPSWSLHYAVMAVRMAMIEGVCSQLSDTLLSWFLVVSNEDTAVGNNKRLMVRKSNYGLVEASIKVEWISYGMRVEM